MGSHPINLAIRFLLEIAGLVALTWVGWHSGEAVCGYVYGIGFPLLAACCWGVFAVPDDPSRSGNAVIAISGVFRLALELVFFGVATWSLFAVGAVQLCWIYGATVLLHYAVSYDRVIWLVQQSSIK